MAPNLQPRSLTRELADLPGGESAGELGWDEVTRWLREVYLQPVGEEAERIADATERSDFYRDRGGPHVVRLINEVFDDAEVKRLRNEWVEAAGYNNVTRRITVELATLYRRNARRSVDGDQNNTRYQSVQRLLNLNSVMLEVQRVAIYQRYLLVGPRVVTATRIPRLDIVEPNHFRLVRHPLDRTRLIAVILDYSINSPALPASMRPSYLVWSAAEYFYLNSAGQLVGEVKPNPFKRVPFVLVALSPPPGDLVDCHTFRDVIRAHKAVWFENVCLLKESKSATKVSVLTGDLSRALRKQMLDTQGGIQLPDGATFQPVDLSMDLSMFRDTADHVLERAAANHGIPPSILHQQGASSGYEIELRYVGVRERRIEQEPYFRSVERELAELISVVLKEERPDIAYDPIGWSVDFGEIQMPLSAKEELEVFETGRRLGLTNTVDETQKRNPDLEDDDDAAWVEIKRNIEIETKRNELMKPLQQISGSMGTEQESAPGVPEMGKTGKPTLEVVP
jgi:hypothetical protein